MATADFAGVDALGELTRRLADRDPRALARALTCLERGGDAAFSLSRELFSRARGHAHVVGITGPPGAGKSTLIDRLVAEFREGGERVAVLAVDPSSPFTGGAVLGDRVRMRERPDDDVFFRSVASRGQLGGLAPVIREGVRALDVAGFDTVVVETVGVGQSEIDVTGLADCAVVVAVPGAGDGVQLMKAGLLEAGDVYAVNRSDQDPPMAARLARDLRAALDHRDSESARPVVTVSAHTGEGVADLKETIVGIVRARETDGSFARRRRQAAERELIEVSMSEALARVMSLPTRMETLVDHLLDRNLDPRSAARQLLGFEGPTAGESDRESRSRSRNETDP